MKPLVIVDANNQLHRLYHAMGAYAAAGAWLRHLAAFSGLSGGDRSRLFVAFDGPRGSDWRKELEPAYKSDRGEKKADLLELLDGANLAATEAGYEVLSVAGAEADDLIAAVVSRNADQRCVIASSDKDLHQLLEAGRVNQLRKYSVSRGELVDCRWYTAAGFTDEYKILPEQWPAWKAIAGDKSDGLPGVPRCGPACATAILQKFPSVPEIIAADQWQLPCKNHERMAIVAAAKSGDLAKWEEISTLRRDCLDLAFQGAP